MTNPVTDDTPERFLRAIAERIAPERVVEVHLFSVIRQGGSESRVAVIAATPETVPEVPDDSYLETDEPLTSAEERPAVQEPEPGTAPTRLTIYQAHYRLVLKGADRGTWDVEVTAEADAPIETVDEVVRGVQRRAGEEIEPERLTGEAFRAALSNEPWTATR